MCERTCPVEHTVAHFCPQMVQCIFTVCGTGILVAGSNVRRSYSPSTCGANGGLHFCHSLTASLPSHLLRCTNSCVPRVFALLATHASVAGSRPAPDPATAGTAPASGPAAHRDETLVRAVRVRVALGLRRLAAVGNLAAKLGGLCTATLRVVVTSGRASITHGPSCRRTGRTRGRGSARRPDNRRSWACRG